MKACSYCGRDNVDDACRCWECGIEFKPPATQVEVNIQLPPAPRWKRVRAVVTTVFIFISFVLFYYSLFWGWASGAGNPPNAEQLYRASRLVLWASGACLLAGLAVWLIPWFHTSNDQG